LRWKSDAEECCVSDSDPFFCNANNKIVSIQFNPKTIPYPGIKYIPKFEELTLVRIEGFHGNLCNSPFSIHVNIFRQPKLKTLIIDTSCPESMATELEPNFSLEELTLKNTRINNLPNAIFKLNNLKKIELGNNTLMNVKIVKFKNSPIQCNFENTNIDCYQEGACSNISSNNYRKCTDDEINEILGNNKNNTSDGQSISNNQDNSNSENKSNSNGILIGGIIGIGILIILSLVIIVIKLNKRDNNTDDDNDIEIYERINQDNSCTKNINLNQDFPTVDNSNNDGDKSVLPTYNQLEYSHAVQPFENTDIESKLLLKTKKKALDEKI